MEKKVTNKMVSHYDSISYNPSIIQNAMVCLLNMQIFESKAQFGKLKYKSPEGMPNNRYNIVNYKDRIDSTFYTDMATTTLAYTMRIFYYSFGDTYPDNDVTSYLEDYFTEGSHDLVNDSSGEYAEFEGDDSLFDANLHIADSLYAYYNEYQLVENDERNNIIGRLGVSDISDEIVIKKSENINGVDMDFYYVGTSFYDFSTKLLQHDYNTKFYSDRMPGNVLEAITSDMGANDIITVTEDYSSKLKHSQYDDSWAAYADYDYGKCIVVQDNYFTEVICHETGHLFDRLNSVSLGRYACVDLDYTNFVDLGRWDGLAEKYADDIATIRIGADIGCGYTPDGMRRQHDEFYAEAFQLYFYSPETRAALPEKVRNRIETEIEKYA